MVKLMAKKSKALPAYSLEEWQAQALQRYGSSPAAHTLLVTPHNAALRIQLRYRVYKEKVRALIKKSSVKDEGSSSSTDADTAAVVGSVKAAVRERGVKGSSVALAVAYTARKDLHGEVETTQPLMLKTTGIKAYAPAPETARSSIQEAAAPSSWTGPQEWNMPSKEFVALSKEDEDVKDRRGDAETKGGAVVKTQETEMENAHGVTAIEEPQQTVRDDKFVDIMHPSWLLSTIEERCGQAAASLGARGQYGSHKQLTMLDIRHTVLDLLFIARSGSSENFHGRAPSSISKHHDNLVQRLASDKTELDIETRRRVRRIFESLQSDMVMPAVRCLGWMLTKTWRMLFSGLHVDVESLHRVRQVLEASGNVSVVFTPTHETHLDYLIISYLCFAYGIPLPRIAAGNNLDLPVIGSFLRANGSFFIRRSFKDDQLYKDVLQNYVHELLHDGNPIEVFIEGGRSRHGRVCKPKMGFLSMFRDYMNNLKQHEQHQHMEDGQEPHKDLLLVPISLDYDRVFEVEEYANQLLGKPKEKESLKVFFQSLWDLMFLRCGHSYVRFGQPVSINAHESLKETAHDLAVQMQSCGTITSTAVVSALLMWKREYVTRDMLQSRGQWLVSELELRGATVAHLQSVNELVDSALTVLDIEVTSTGVIHSKVSFPTRALELGFYRNHLVHVFLPDMALLGAIDALRLQATVVSNVVTLSKSEVLATASFVWKFLNHICRHERVDLAQHLETLELRVPELSLSADHVQLDLRKWRVSRVAGFALSLHWSFIDSLFLATLATWSLLAAEADSKPSPICLERDMLRLAQLLARELFVDRSISHAEAFCSESLKQAFEFLHEIGTVSFESCATTGARQYKLAANVDREELLKLQDRVNGLRKPKSFLYRDDQAVASLSQEETTALVQRGVDESQQLAQRGRARGGVYATWMSHE